jgi:hypothetical protein
MLFYVFGIALKKEFMDTLMDIFSDLYCIAKIHRLG